MNTTNSILISIIALAVIGGGWYVISSHKEMSPTADTMMKDDSMMHDDSMMTASDSPADSMMHESTSTDAMMGTSSTDAMMH